MGYLTQANIGGSDYKLAGTLYGTCVTAADNNAKVVTCADFDSYDTGVILIVKFTYGNTASNPTLNVNGTGAKSIIPTSTQWSEQAAVAFVYNGSSWTPVALKTTDVDTKNTAGATDSTNNKLFLIGALSQGVNILGIHKHAIARNAADCIGCYVISTSTIMASLSSSVTSVMR